MSSEQPPTLTDRAGKGGVVAQDGFDYQIWDAISRVPGWLRNPVFDGVTLEGLEDFEARFFAPHSPHSYVLDRFQAKSGELTRSGFIEVVESFQKFDSAFPDVARVQTLVTPRLPTKIGWVAADTDRVRRARPFYAPFAKVTGASDAKLSQDLADEFGRDLGTYIADCVEVACRHFSARGAAQAMFVAALADEFAHLVLDPRGAAQAFDQLLLLANRSRGLMITRRQLIDTIQSCIGEQLSNDTCVPLHIRSDRSGEQPTCLEIDASAFSGSAAGFPRSERWQSDIVDALVSSAQWAHRRGANRIHLIGSLRLTTAMAVGWAFRSTNGFEVEHQLQSGVWSTDASPDHRPRLAWDIRVPDRLVGGRLIVGIGVLRNPLPDVLASTGADANSVLAAYCSTPIADAGQQQCCAHDLKAAIARAAADLRAQAIDLFIAGPSSLAVALGHRWNAMPVTQLHEFVVTDRRYTPTARLG